jgi:competence protein ComFA
MWKCERCQSSHPDLFFVFHNEIKCRTCLSVMVSEPIEVSVPTHLIEDIELSFELTPKQKEVSHRLSCSNSKLILLEAVCGAGKTEIVLELIKNRLNKKHKVGWAIPRRQVVLELTARLQKVFPKLSVIAVCEGYTEVLSADLVLFTTHQAFRYQHSFDILILDEVDAFPYKGNSHLEYLVSQTYSKQCIMMSATIPKSHRKLIETSALEHVSCYERPSRVPLMIPQLIKTYRSWMIFWVLLLLRRQKKWLIFVPTHALAKQCAFLLQCEALTSKSQNKEDIIQRFSTKDEGRLVCTTILERGVTFYNVHVMVMMAHHQVFDEASLVQIAGRVGRHMNAPRGDVYFLVSSYSHEVHACIQTLQNANHIAYGV